MYFKIALEVEIIRVTTSFLRYYSFFQFGRRYLHNNFFDY